MTAKAEKEVNIEKIIERAVNKAVKATILLGAEKAKTEKQNLFSKTQSRLYAYAELKNNIDKYNLDIEDLQKESPGHSKDLVFFSTHGGGTRLSAEEVQEARIMIMQKKIYRDQTEIDDINFALDSVKNDEYYPIIEMKYGLPSDKEDNAESPKCMNDENIAEVIHCDPSTVRRQKNRLVRKIAVKLYGAQVVT